MIQTTDPRIVVRMRNALSRTRSISAPDRIDPVVAANRAKAPQKTPLAASATRDAPLSTCASLDVPRARAYRPSVGLSLYELVPQVVPAGAQPAARTTRTGRVLRCSSL
jgi:hypothetical protein